MYYLVKRYQITTHPSRSIPRAPLPFVPRASLPATRPDETFREAQMARADAQIALKVAKHTRELIADWQYRLDLQVLAAAHAENNNLQEAIMVQTRALNLALANGPRSEISQGQEQYQSRNPIRDESGLL
jgi:hypothetical protein